MCATLISAVDLAELLSSSAATVLDVRYGGPGAPLGHEDYLAGHIPGATYLDLNTSLAAPPAVPGGRHPLPNPVVFADAMRAAGVSRGRTVVVYDNWMSIAAARAWWLLSFHGHDDVRVLDGGWRAWQAAGFEVAEGEHIPEAGDFQAGSSEFATVDAEGAFELAATGVLLDARPANRFRGEDETVDPVAGHIPGARSLPALELVDGDGRLLDAKRLRARFLEVGADGGDVAVYCGSGIQASHVVLAAAVAGLPIPRLYPGSWSDWITDPSRPVAVGP